MKWSWKLGEVRGIGVYVHATFLILMGFIALSHWSAGHSVAQTLEGVGFILALFGCVVLHEFGHALMAARYEIKTRDITLLPIGGVARLERMSEEPIQELWVALAGPAVNVVIAAALFAWLQFTTAFTLLEQLSVTSGPFLQRLMVVNVMLIVFNSRVVPETARKCQPPSDHRRRRRSCNIATSARRYRRAALRPSPTSPASIGYTFHAMRRWSG